VRLADLLRECAELESRIGELYQGFAARWHADRDLASFWTEMASAERQHASLLSAAAALAIEKPERLEAIDATSLASIRGFVRALTSWPAPTNVDDALKTALELEELELDRVYAELLRISGGESAGAGTDEQFGIEEHVELLLAMIERRATDQALRRRVEGHRRSREAAPPASLGAALRGVSKRLWGERRAPPETTTESKASEISRPATKNRGGGRARPSRR
jgi:rubrerythrin